MYSTYYINPSISTVHSLYDGVKKWATFFPTRKTGYEKHCVHNTIQT